jgi:hypothetical protein
VTLKLFLSGCRIIYIDIEVISKLLALTLVIVVGLTAAGFAQEAPEGGQEIVPPPMPDPGTTSRPICVDQKNERANGLAVLGVPLWSRAAHVVQFRPVGVEQNFEDMDEVGVADGECGCDGATSEHQEFLA